MIRLFIALILSTISFRGAARALEIIAPLVPEGSAPSPNGSKSKLRQTAYAFLLPPDLKTKARWMNLEPLIAWTRRVQQFLDDPQAGLAKAQAPEDLQVLEEKIGWIRRYREPMAEWSMLMEAAGVILQYIRTHGYHRDAVGELRARVAPFQTESLEGFFTEVLAFVGRQASQANSVEQGDRRLPGSTEVLESLIGRGEATAGAQQKRLHEGGVGAGRLGGEVQRRRNPASAGSDPGAGRRRLDLRQARHQPRRPALPRAHRPR